MKDKTKNVITDIMPTAIATVEGCFVSIALTAIMTTIQDSKKRNKLESVAMTIGIASLSGFIANRIVEKQTIQYADIADWIVDFIEQRQESKSKKKAKKIRK